MQHISLIDFFGTRSRVVPHSEASLSSSTAPLSLLRGDLFIPELEASLPSESYTLPISHSEVQGSQPSARPSPEKGSVVCAHM